MKKLLLFGLLVCAAAFAEEKPNIVFILADDLGLGDISYHARTIEKKEPVVQTPTIDSLAAQGLWFTDGHSATALCAPTRYAVMSGNNNYRSYAPPGVWSTFAPTAFKKEEITLGTVVRDAGYTTGFFGKWHLGGLDFNVVESDEIYRGNKNANLTGKVDMTRFSGAGPKFCGFDYDYTSPCGVQGSLYILYENQQWAPWAENSEIVYLDKNNAINPKDITSKGPGMGDSNWDSRELGKRLSQKAVDFIKSSAAKDKPFFVYYCSPMVHEPHCPPDEFDGESIAGSTPSPHLDMVRDLDHQVKRIVDALKACGEFENTLFVFNSDNGGLSDSLAAKQGYHPSGGWNGSKNRPEEGGHRIPFFASWPGHIQPGITDELAINLDMVATFAALVGTEIPAGQALDSNNLLPLLTGKGTYQSREYLINQAGAGQEVMLRKMPWKLVIQSNFKRTKFEPKALYNLKTDPHEDHDLIKNPEYKELYEKMFQQYMNIMQSGRPTAPGR